MPTALTVGEGENVAAEFGRPIPSVPLEFGLPARRGVVGVSSLGGPGEEARGEERGLQCRA